MPAQPARAIDRTIGQIENGLEGGALTGKPVAQMRARKLEPLLSERQFKDVRMVRIHRGAAVSVPESAVASVVSATPSLCNSARLVANNLDPARAKREAMAAA